MKFGTGRQSGGGAGGRGARRGGARAEDSVLIGSPRRGYEGRHAGHRGLGS